MANHFKHDPNALRQVLFDRAKSWWTAGLLCKFGGFALSTVLVLTSAIPKYAPFLVAGVALLAEWLQWHSDSVKGVAETLQRKLDMRDSFGWAITGVEMTDYLTEVSDRLWRSLPAEGGQEPYFESHESVGATRALENVRESAWWSQHLASTLGKWCFTVTGILVAASLAILDLALQTANDPDTRAAVGRAITALITFIVSFGLVRLAVGYSTFSRASARIVDRAEAALDAESEDMVQAIKLLHEYQLARASAPLIPTRYYRLKRDSLNRLWHDYLSRSTRLPSSP